MEGTVASEKKLVGTLSSGGSLTGGAVAVFGKDGKSAYEVAVKNGFEGSETEWLASLVGERGEPGKRGDNGEKGDTGNSGVYLGSGDMPSDCNVQIDPNGEVLTIEKIIEMLTVKPSRISTATLLADHWIGTESPYSQVVTVVGATENSQVDLTPSVEQLAIFHNKDLAFVTENVDGVITVYAIGQKPENDYTIQVTLTEVIV